MPIESAVEPALPSSSLPAGAADALAEGADAAAGPPQGPNASIAQIRPDLSALTPATLARTAEPVELSGYDRAGTTFPAGGRVPDGASAGSP